MNEINFVKMGHKDKGTIPEVVLDRVLTNILWIKNPKIDVSLELIIAAHSKELFMKRNVWDKFYDIIQKIKNEEHGEKIKNEEIFTVIAEKCLNEEIEEIEFSQKELDKIIKGLVQRPDPEIMRLIETIEDKKKDQEYEEKFKSEIKKIHENSKIYEQTLIVNHCTEEKELKNEIKILEVMSEKKDEEFATQIQELKNDFQGALANEKANTYVILSKMVISGILVVVGLNWWDKLIQISSIVPFLIFAAAILNVKFDLLWNKVRDYVKLELLGKI